MGWQVQSVARTADWIPRGQVWLEFEGTLPSVVSECVELMREAYLVIQGNLPHSESTDLNVNPITKLASEIIKIVFDRSSGKSNLTLSLHTFNHHSYLL